MKLGLTFLRTVIGVLFFGHGTQKLFGWFGGHGLEGTAGFFETIGLKPGRRHATAAGAAEVGGGALLALGFLTPAAAAMLIGVMSTAVRKVHLKNGPWVTNGGYEYNLALVAMLVALTDVGPGDLSLDHALGTEVKGPLVALLALAAGIGGAAVLTAGSVPDSAEPAAPEAPVGEEPAAEPTAEDAPATA